MAQTTGGFSRGGAWEIQVSADGTTWHHVAGEAASMAWSGGEQRAGEQATADGKAPIVKGSGKHGAVTVTVNLVYTKNSDQLFDRVRDAWEGDKHIYLRGAPQGGIGTVVGNDLWTCVDDAGAAYKCPIIAQPLPPELDASSGDIALSSFSVLAPAVARTATTTA